MPFVVQDSTHGHATAFLIEGGNIVLTGAVRAVIARWDNA